jgi:Beta-propeller repeat
MKSKIYRSFLWLAACAYAAAAQPDAARILATAPLRFEPAAGGSDAFVARGARFQFEFTGDRALLRTQDKNVRLRFDGADQRAQIRGEQRLRSTTNLYFGNDASQWRQGVPNYGRLNVQGLYPGVDLAYYGNGGELEYDLTVRPGADPRQIRLRLEGNQSPRLDPHGDLVSHLIQRRPVAYQVRPDGYRQIIRSRYRKNTDGSYGFALGPYDRRRELVIDPVLTVAQYFSASYQDVAYAIGHDSHGLIYIGGTTYSTDLALTGDSLQTSNAGGADLFLAVINPTLSAGSQIIYVTYIGGTSNETFGAMTVGRNGDVYLTGSTTSATFPLQNAAQSAIGGSSGAADAFVTWLDPSQALVYSTFFGGGGLENGKAIAVDASGKIWISGDTQSTDLPNTGGFQDSLIGAQNMFVAGFDPSQSAEATRIYSIYIGGTHWDEAFGVAAAADGTIWLAGGTFSPDIWIEGHPYQSQYGGDGDAYVAHLNPGLGANALLSSSFLGGSGIDEATSMLLDPAGRVVLSGYTLSTNLPVTSDAFQARYGGDTDAFIAILDPSKSPQLVYSTYFGGSGADAAFDLKQDSNGALYVSGYTESAGLPTSDGSLQPSYDGSLDAFGLKLDPSQAGTAGIEYFTYLGSDGLQIAYGIDFDANGNMYLAGSTSSAILAAIGGPERGSIAGTVDAFVVGFSAASSPTTTTSSNAVAPIHLRRWHWPISPHR